MKIKHTLTTFAILFSISLNAQDDLRKECNQVYSLELNLFNKTLKSNIIGGAADSEKGYVKVDTWSNEGPYFPKKFDIELEIYSSFLGFLDSSYYDTTIWNLKIEMKLVGSLSADRNMSLNKQVFPSVKLEDNINFSLEDFDKRPYIKKRIENIELESHYLALENRQLNLNHIIFNLILTNKYNECRFQHIFLCN